MFGFSTVSRLLTQMTPAEGGSLLLPALVVLCLVAVIGLVWSLGLIRRLSAQARELARNEARYRTLLETGLTPVVVLRGDEIVYSNAQGWELFGRPKEAGREGVSLSDIFDGDSVHSLLGEAAGSYSGLDAPHPRKPRVLTLDRLDGVSMDVEVSAGTVYCMGEESIQLWIQDVTERRKTERERRQLERRVQETARMESIALLAGGVAHEFNNHLTSVLGNAELVQEDLGEESPHSFMLQEIVDAGLRAAKLTEALLAYTGQESPELEARDLAQLVRGSEPLLRSGLMPNLTLELELEETWTRVDPRQLNQVVLNLVINAGEASDGSPGKAVIRVRSEAFDAEALASLAVGDGLSPGPFAVLEVEDDGPGMDAATRDRVFDPFFSTRFMGRGLGLAAVRGIVETHGGGIILESREGEGSRFRVILPLEEAS